MALLRYRINFVTLLLVVAQVASSSTLKPVETITKDSSLDLGCVVLAAAPEPIKIKPNPKAAEPYNTYTGCGSMTLFCSFPAQLSVHATGIAAVSGKWDATARPSILSKGTTKVAICVNATELTILDNFQAGTTVKIAEVVVTIIPR
jgi:hypothetical protein